MTAFTNTFFRRSRPYLLLTLIAILAYLPVSLMVFSLKNDILALEFPIKYFISECLHNGVQPFWFNTWSRGFPLESIITWSIFSPLQFLWASLFHYSLYTLHAEFIFYISLCGCSFYYLLTKHVMMDRKLSFLFSICYMLSGFTVSSSQWLLYISAAAFLPLIVSLLISLFKKPSFRSSLLFACVFYCMVTGIYVAFSIVISYILAGMVLIYLGNKIRTKQPIKQTLLYLSISIAICILLLSPALLSSLTVLHNIQRGDPITSDPLFFSSNYFHPKGLTSLFFPLTSVRTHAPNTEPLMLDTYIGLLPFILAPVWLDRKNRFSKLQIALVLISLFFLLISFGTLTPLREWLNVLPGFSYFRNASLFRIFFIFFLLLFISYRCQAIQWRTIFESGQKKKIMIRSAEVFFIFLLLFFFIHINSLKGASFTNWKTAITSFNLSQAYFFNSLIQLFAVFLMILSLIRKRKRLFEITVILELIINTLICTPFFTVSSFTVKQVEDAFGSVQKFPLQSQALNEVPVNIQKGMAIWYNTNVFKKEVSSLESYWGPLVLKSHKEMNDSTKNEFTHSLLFSPQLNNTEIKLVLLEPNHIKASLSTNKSADIILLQNYYEGWSAFKDNQKLQIDTAGQSGMKIHVNGSGTINFIYDKKGLFILSVIIDLFVLSVIILMGFIKQRRLHRGSLPGSII